MRAYSCVAILLTLLTPAPGLAQQTSNLTGVVTDAQNAVLPGVTVTASSPALIGTQSAVTEANGSYRFATVPPGTYTLTFELSGFQKLRRENIVLALGQTITVDSQLQVQSLQESVTVTAASPLVDTQTTSVGSTLNTEKLIGVPTASDL